METKIYLISQSYEFEEALGRSLGGKKFRIVGNQTNIPLALWEIKVIKPAIVILDFDNGETDAFEIISDIRKTTPSNIKFIIVTGGYNHDRFESALSFGVAFCMMQPCDFDVLSEKIKSLSKQIRLTSAIKSAQNSSNDDDEVSSILYSIGVPNTCKGYSLLKTAITCAVSDYSLVNNMMSKLYPLVADLHFSNVACTERNIRNAIELTWNRGNLDYLAEIFGSCIKTRRGIPSNSQFIATIADMIIYNKQ